jgi:hypothetical protein
MSNYDFTPERRARFLEVLSDTCSPKAAAKAVGIARSSAYYHREHDVDFRLAWDKCVDQALDAVLEESYRRAVVGVDEPVIFQGQVSKEVSPDGEERPLTITKYSDRLLEVLMKWRYGDQLADRLRVRVEESTGLTPEALLAMPSEERAQLVALLSKYSASRPAKEDADAEE